MRQILASCFCLTLLLGANRCDEDVDLGANDPPMNAMCVDSDCGDGQPRIACAAGETDFVCRPGADGTCRWELSCSDLPTCQESDCPAARNLIGCASGMENWICERNLVNGDCQWQLLCDDDVSPDGDTPAAPDAGMGSTPGGDDSVTPNPGCDVSQCPAVQPQIGCADGDGTWFCVGDGQTCSWDLSCPDIGDVVCSDAECPTTRPAPDRTCSDGFRRQPRMPPSHEWGLRMDCRLRPLTSRP